MANGNAWIHLFFPLAQSVGDAEYTNGISEEGEDSPNKCSGYDTNQSDGEASVMR